MVKSQLQKIYFGPSGCGKSHQIKEHTQGMGIFRTAFHANTSYISFVGGNELSTQAEQTTYSFMPQIFVDAYVEAWKDLSHPVCLIIEEINQGDCGKIFGNLLQLLDRDENGLSEYPLTPDNHLRRYLNEVLSDVNKFTIHTDVLNQLLLPPNLFLYATINTSIQSSFPMESNFKRRWDWQYVPVDYEDAEKFIIVFDSTKHYSWAEFIRAVNKHICNIIEREDKQLGNRFVDFNDGNTIAKNIFKNKVLSYLWTDVYCYEPQERSIFNYWTDEIGQTDIVPFTLNQIGS